MARPLTTILFYRGAFTLENNLYTAMLLRRMIFAVPAFAALQILVNGYYAKKNTLRPMLISSLATVISFFIYDLPGKKMAGPGIAIAGGNMWNTADCTAVPIFPSPPSRSW